uniref:Uncharacterized protein n=1 Tax=Plectus sambesii TaxID=2011161 RepID=A0A914VT54_9BILA
MSLSTRPSTVYFLLLFILLQQDLLHAYLQTDRVHHDCQGENSAPFSLLHRLNAYLRGGSDDSIFNEISDLFRGQHPSATDSETMQCLHTIFLDISNSYKLLKESIKLLNVKQEMINTLLEARRIMDKIYAVYLSLEDYKAHKETASWKKLTKKCDRYDPSESLMQLYLRAVTEPRLFDTILLGTDYSVHDFERISSAWLRQAAMCTILAQECAFVKQSNASKPLQNRLNQRINRQLEDIRSAYLLAHKNMTTNFHTATPLIIKKQLELIVINELGLAAGANQIYKTLASKFPFRAWAVMLYNRVDFNQTNVHAHESSTNSAFFINGALHTVVAHSSDRSLNCSLFMTRVRHHRLKHLFENNDNYAAFVAREGHLGNDIVTIRTLLLKNENDVPESYFISVIRYQPHNWSLTTVAVNGEHDFHHIEYLRSPKTMSLKKFVLIGWC